MKSISFGAVALGAAATLALASGANAQAQGAPQGYSLSANAPGICIVDTAEVIATSAVGKAVAARMNQLTTQVNSELNPEKTALDNERKSIDAAAKAATTQAQIQPLQQRQQAWTNRANALQQKAVLREAELRATEQKAVNRISTEAVPVLRQVAAQRSCAVLINSAAVVEANPSMDITAGVIAGLNAKIQTFAFERENLAAQAARPAQ